MRGTRRATLALALTAALAAGGGARAQSEADGTALAAALARVEAGDWAGAEAAARAGDGTIASDVVLWLRLRDGTGTWAEYRAFLADHPDWPSREALRRHAERAMPGGLPPLVVLAFFREAPPATGDGALRHADALTALGRKADAEAELVRAWRTLSATRSAQATISERWREVVGPHDAERVDMLLWRGLIAEAQPLLVWLPPEARKVAEARIAVRRDLPEASAKVEALSAALRDDPGLAFERYQFRVRDGRWDEAEEFLLRYSTSAERLGRPDAWMERRANLARMALRRGDAKTAYAIAARNFGGPDSGPDYADAEWVAGYVALTELDDPKAAIGHFQRFRAAVATPISLGRAGYWLGRAHAAAGDAPAAQAAWTEAATYQTSFYGQLAALRAGVPPDPRLAGTATPADDWRGQPVLATAQVHAGRALILAGDERTGATFLRHAASGAPAPTRAALAELATELGAPQIGVRIAKDAAAEGVLLPDQYYPVPPMAAAAYPAPTEYVLAIARQESEFDAEAQSPVGARGLMQLMPATAAQVAEDLGLAYAPEKLTADPVFNARLGSAYLAELLERYDGSYVLATAAYNAGPGRVNDWIEAYGDPRAPGADAIAWMEAIPFEETRNYVMRVLESLHVYRARLDGTAPRIQLAEDIAQTG